MPQFTTFLTHNGVPLDAIIWLLITPIAITLVIIARHIFGIKGFGITTPLLIGFAFTTTGMTPGLIIFFAALSIGFLIRSLLARVRLLYLPKIALILSGITLAVLFLLPLLAASYGKPLAFPEIAFSLVILILSAEQFISSLNERGLRKTLSVILEVTALALATSYLATWQWLIGIVITYPLLIIIAIFLINLALGRWTGLRLSEYLRFKDILSK